ncbi:MAG: glycosyltransferase family 39 protein [Pseudomonadota bacterium]
MLSILGRLQAVTLACLSWAERSVWRHALLLAAVACVVILPGIASLPPTDRDESRYVQASRQMLETRDFVDIRFQEAPRWKKPAGIYWLQAGAAAVLGGTEAPIWVHRIPSALAIFLAGLLAAWALRPVLGLRAANLAGIMLILAMMPTIEANLAKTDAVLLAFCVAAMGALGRLLLQPDTGLRAAHAVLWSSLGAGILIKGPIILMPTAGALAWMMIAARSFAPLRQIRPLPGLLLMGLIALPWGIAIWLRTDGAFFEAAVIGDLLTKVTEGVEQHWGPPGYYLATIWATLWPWAPLMLIAAPFAWQRRRQPEIRFLLGWIIPFWVAYEFFSTKLPHYVLPVMPAMLGLVALWVVSTEKETPSPARLLIMAALFVLPALVLALAAILGLPLIEGTFSTPAALLGLVAIIALAAGARALVERRVAAFIGAAALAALTIYPAILQFALPRLDTVFLSPRLAEARAQFAGCSPRPLTIVGYYEPSLVVAAGTDTVRISLDEAKERLATESGWLIFIEEQRGASLQDFVEEAGFPITILATVTGFNYNRGDPTTIYLVARLDDPTLIDCRAPDLAGLVQPG